MEAFIPPTTIAVLFGALAISRFENQRWSRARAAGMKGANQAAGLVVDLTGVVGTLFAFGFLVAYGYYFGWQPAVGLLALGIVVTMVGGTLVGAILGDNLAIWAIATLAVWPLMFALYFVTFG